MRKREELWRWMLKQAYKVRETARKIIEEDREDYIPTLLLCFYCPRCGQPFTHLAALVMSADAMRACLRTLIDEMVEGATCPKCGGPVYFLGYCHTSEMWTVRAESMEEVMRYRTLAEHSRRAEALVSVVVSALGEGALIMAEIMPGRRVGSDHEVRVPVKRLRGRLLYPVPQIPEGVL